MRNKKDLLIIDNRIVYPENIERNTTCTGSVGPIRFVVKLSDAEVLRYSVKKKWYQFWL